MSPCTSLACVLLLAQAQPEPKFTSSLTLVRVDVQVALPDGRVITGLKAEDFAVFDDGQPQPVRNFVAESGPLDLMLVLDVSGSMRTQLSALGTGARFALEKLREGDRIGIVTFTARANVVQPLTADFRAAEQVLRTLKTGGGTDIYGGIQTAAKYFIALKEPRDTGQAPRRALLTITDNIAFSMLKSKDKQTVREVWEADAVLNALIAADPRAQEAASRVRSRGLNRVLLTDQDVDEVATQTGGETVSVQAAAEALPEMLERIRTRYLLYFAAPESKPGAFHRIRVDLTDAARKRYPIAMLHARLEYYAAGKPR